MKILISYSNGASETLNVELEGGTVSFAGRWIPGLLIQEPKICQFKSDFFEAALNEGICRSGEVPPFEDELDFVGFTWKLFGNEEEACHDKLLLWSYRIGPSFNPEVSGEDYLYEGFLRLLSVEEAAQYDRDLDCWLTYLNDPVAAFRLLIGGASS
jgi:hypothetical protein